MELLYLEDGIRGGRQQNGVPVELSPRDNQQVSSAGHSTVERALKELERVMQSPRSGDSARAVATRRLPKELMGGESKHIGLVEAQVVAIASARAALLEDARFEYLDRSVDDIVWSFAAACHLDHRGGHVRAFVEQHRREPMDLVCYLPVEYLKVGEERNVAGVRLLPQSDARIPAFNTPFASESGCVAAVRVRGTNLKRTADRARGVAAHALRVLRAALDEHPSVDDQQLHFRLGAVYAFAEHGSGWRRPEDAASELTLGENLIEFALTRPVAQLPAEPTTDVKKKAVLATKWMERASFAGEPVVALLYLFFALEALLGRESEKRKGPGLAYRQAMLSHAVTGEFTNPSETLALYGGVRSCAVHGENLPHEVSWRDVHRFGRGVGATLGQYLGYADTHDFKRRGHLLSALDEHPDRPELVAWLHRNAPALAAVLEPSNSGDKPPALPSALASTSLMTMRLRELCSLPATIVGVAG